MAYIEVIVEHETLALSQSFTYRADGPLEPGIRVRVPFGRQKLTGMVMETRPENWKPDREIKDILEVVDQDPVLDARQIALAAALARRTIASLMSVVRCMLPQALAVRSVRKPPAREFWVMKTGLEEGLRPSQKEGLSLLPEQIRFKEAKDLLSAGRVDTLIKKGALCKQARIVRHGALPKREQQPWPPLNEEQQKAISVIEQASTRVSLLHGVTGSGKTEVFYHLARHALDRGKQVLILVPEIALTPMMEERFARRFDCDVFACHSRLSSSQMLSVWNDVREAGPCIVIGTRKSVFLPYTNLGLIIMDEEHDGSYKQDSHPRYHARDAVMELAGLHGACVVLASATPSLESYARALRKVYTLAALTNRAAGKDASIALVDLRVQRTWNHFSAQLIQAIQKNLSRSQKSLILLNRRGFLPTVRCMSCQEYLVCDECNVPLSYHKREHALVCHVCGKRFAMEMECPHCHQRSLSQDGQGTERLEEDVQSLFPAARIVRMDHDTTSRKGEHARRLLEFEENGDILMGTQMIAKGLDFHDVTLVAVLSIDSILSRPDYLASEKAYQLAEQAAGRAGRGALPGRVIIQTFNPDHFILRCIVRHDYRAFFAQEMKYRHAGFYPPYSFLATIVISHPDMKTAWRKAEESMGWLEREGLEVLGPIEISMRNRQPRFRLVLKERKEEKLINTLWAFAFWFEKNSGSCRYDINVNPMSLED